MSWNKIRKTTYKYKIFENKKYLTLIFKNLNKLSMRILHSHIHIPKKKLTLKQIQHPKVLHISILRVRPPLKALLFNILMTLKGRHIRSISCLHSKKPLKWFKIMLDMGVSTIKKHMLKTSMYMFLFWILVLVVPLIDCFN